MKKIFTFLLAFLLVTNQALAALSVNAVYEINGGATANNVNASGFNPSNANMLADLTTDSNTANTDDTCQWRVSVGHICCPCISDRPNIIFTQLCQPTVDCYQAHFVFNF